MLVLFFFTSFAQNSSNSNFVSPAPDAALLFQILASLPLLFPDEIPRVWSSLSASVWRLSRSHHTLSGPSGVASGSLIYFWLCSRSPPPVEADFIKGIRSDLRASFTPYSLQRLTRTHAHTQKGSPMEPRPPPCVYELIRLLPTGWKWEHQQRVAARSHIGRLVYARADSRRVRLRVVLLLFFLSAWSALATGALSLVTPDGSPGSIMHQRPDGRLSLLSFVASPHQFPSAKVQQEKQRWEKEAGRDGKDSMAGDKSITGGGETFSSSLRLKNKNNLNCEQ